MLGLHNKSDALLERALNRDFLQNPLVVIHNSVGFKRCESAS